MSKKKETSPYAIISYEKITAPNKVKNQPKVDKISDGGLDLRARREK